MFKVIVLGTGPPTITCRLFCGRKVFLDIQFCYTETEWVKWTFLQEVSKRFSFDSSRGEIGGGRILHFAVIICTNSRKKNMEEVSRAEKEERAARAGTMGMSRDTDYAVAEQHHNPPLFAFSEWRWLAVTKSQSCNKQHLPRPCAASAIRNVWM